MHFSPSEHEETGEKVLAYLMISQHWVILVSSIFNLIGNVIQVANEYILFIS